MQVLYLAGRIGIVLLNAYWHLILEHDSIIHHLTHCIPAQRLLASNLRTRRSLDPFTYMNSQSILQAPVESMP